MSARRGAAALVVVLGLTLVAASCGGNVSVEGGAHLNVCACWAARELEAKKPDIVLGPCLSCWVTTIVVGGPGGGNGTCHYDQTRCLEDADCRAVLICVQSCQGATCMNTCIEHAGSEIAHDLFMDWSRCFCTECFDVCEAYETKSSCTAAE